MLPCLLAYFYCEKTPVTSWCFTDHTIQASRAQLQSMNISSSTQDDRRHTEDKLASILIWIVIAFLVCHFPRILLSFHEMLVIRNTLKCRKEGYFSFPLWALQLAEFSHVLLVLNSSLNGVIYCMFSSKYRAQAKSMLLTVKTKLSNDTRNWQTS